MEFENYIKDLKVALDVHKEVLDKAYETECYNWIIEEASNIERLSYAINILEKNISKKTI